MLRLQASWQTRVPEDGEGLLLSTTTTGRTLRVKGRRDLLLPLLDALRAGIEPGGLPRVLAGWPDGEAGRARRLIERLQAAGIVLSRALPPRGSLDADTIYDRQIRFFDRYESDELPGTALNERLQASRVVVFGLGGYGVWLVQLLHRMGVREVVGVDDDLVELPNLHRQFLYGTRDVGRPKALVCAEVLNAFDGAARFVPVVERATDVDRCAAIVDGADLVLNQFGYDLPSDQGEHSLAFHTVAAGCELAGVPSLTFGNQWSGPLRVPGTAGACAGCLVHHDVFRDRLHRQARATFSRPAPSIAARTGFDASVAVWEAVRHLTGLGSPLYSTALVIDTLSYANLRLIPLLPSVDCVVCRGERAPADAGRPQATPAATPEAARRAAG